MEKIIQNIKVVKIMKASKYTDSDIAKYLGISVKDFLEAIDSDPYLKEVFESAQEKLVSEIESKFLEAVMAQLENGKTEDAKWVLERTTGKYSKKEQVELNVKNIDDIIRGV